MENKERIGEGSQTEEVRREEKDNNTKKKTRTRIQHAR